MDRKRILPLLVLAGAVIVAMLAPKVVRHFGAANEIPLTPTATARVENTLTAPATASPTATPAIPATPSPTSGALTSPLRSVLPTPERGLAEPVYSYRVVQVYPHDREAFTQGLVYHNGSLFEGTGLRGQSSLRRVELESGRVAQFHALEQTYFGEGIAILGDMLYQLTWQARVGFVYDWRTFEPLGTWSYESEGWGLTHDGAQLIMSDGTSTLRFLDPDTLQVTRQVEVQSGSGPVARLNELEYMQGQVLANVWQTDLVACIDPQSGMVQGWIDLSGLLSAEERAATDVLNGIAYDAEGDRLFVTGKLWPKLFQIEIGTDPGSP